MTNHTDTRSLYVLIVSLLGTVIALPAVWYFTEAAYAAPGSLTTFSVTPPTVLAAINIGSLAQRSLCSVPPIIVVATFARVAAVLPHQPGAYS